MAVGTCPKDHERTDIAIIFWQLPSGCSSETGKGKRTARGTTIQRVGTLQYVWLRLLLLLLILLRKKLISLSCVNVNFYHVNFSFGTSTYRCIVLCCIVHLPYLIIANLSLRIGREKGKFLYSKLSSPDDCIKCFSRYFPGRPIQSYIISASLGSIQPRRNYAHWREAMASDKTCLTVLQHRIRTRILLGGGPKLSPGATAPYEYVMDVTI